MTRARLLAAALFIGASAGLIAAQSFEQGGWPTYNGD